MDTLAIRREVTSPGGMTARGLRVLERARPALGVQRRSRRSVGNAARPMTIVAAAFVGHVAAFVDDLAWVYTIAIILYVLTSMVLAAGLRIPYNRWSDAMLTFLRDVSEPCLRLFGASCRRSAASISVRSSRSSSCGSPGRWQPARLASSSRAPPRARSSSQAW